MVAVEDHRVQGAVELAVAAAVEPSLGDCFNTWLANFVIHGTTKGLDTSCDATAVVMPLFPLAG